MDCLAALGLVQRPRNLIAAPNISPLGVDCASATWFIVAQHILSNSTDGLSNGVYFASTAAASIIYISAQSGTLCQRSELE